MRKNNNMQSELIARFISGLIILAGWMIFIYLLKLSGFLEALAGI